MNIHDYLKHQTTEEIKDYYATNSINASIAMMHVTGDFNISTLVRNANFFGFKDVHYIGKKKWDRRGSVGTHHYTPVHFHKTQEAFLANFYGKAIIAVENNIPEYQDKTIDIFDFSFNDYFDPIFIFGEENKGLSNEILDRANVILTIPSYGSVRSLNVGTTSGIVMSFYRSFLEKTQG
jgi:tRNA G18 (ribose-2'-O)-methylase SpoU